MNPREAGGQLSVARTNQMLAERSSNARKIEVFGPNALQIAVKDSALFRFQIKRWVYLIRCMNAEP